MKKHKDSGKRGGVMETGSLPELVLRLETSGILAAKLPLLGSVDWQTNTKISNHEQWILKGEAAQCLAEGSMGTVCLGGGVLNLPSERMHLMAEAQAADVHSGR